MSEEISKALGLTHVELTPVEVKEIPQVDSDFEYARGNMIAAIEKGQEALNGILEVAGMSQHPRSYEVAAKLLDAVTNANEKLLDLTKKKMDISGEIGQPKSVTNNLFVGSTAELQKLIKNNGNNI
jgi:hypothetical protein